MLFGLKEMFMNGKIGYCLSYEIDYGYRFVEDDEKVKKIWVSVLLMMKIMKKRMEGEGRR